MHRTAVLAARPKTHTSDLEREVEFLRNDLRLSLKSFSMLQDAHTSQIASLHKIYGYQLSDKNSQILWLSNGLNIGGVIDHLEDDWIREYEKTKKLPKGLHPFLQHRKHLKLHGEHAPRLANFDSRSELWKVLKEHEFLKNQMLEIADNQGKKLITMDIFTKFENLVDGVYRKTSDQVSDLLMTGEIVFIDCHLLSPDEIRVAEAVCRLFKVKFKMSSGPLNRGLLDNS
ncbi:uncharacterized protein LOC129585960 isoform X2 [Paramacrobiotus metropolitanus]|nr:uncharacterized protein LOC129585960 isoform X2 [Paramacrobiotus metropolitanus]